LVRRNNPSESKKNTTGLGLLGWLIAAIAGGELSRIEGSEVKDTALKPMLHGLVLSTNGAPIGNPTPVWIDQNKKTRTIARPRFLQPTQKSGVPTAGEFQ
jgi:hypothetical protein